MQARVLRGDRVAVEHDVGRHRPGCCIQNVRIELRVVDADDAVRRDRPGPFARCQRLQCGAGEAQRQRRGSVAGAWSVSERQLAVAAGARRGQQPGHRPGRCRCRGSGRASPAAPPPAPARGEYVAASTGAVATPPICASEEMPHRCRSKRNRRAASSQQRDVHAAAP